MNVGIASLLTVSGLALTAFFLGLLVVVRGASALPRVRDLERREGAGLLLLGATGLPPIVALCVSCGAITPQLGVSPLGAGMTFVLVLLLLVVAIVGRGARPAPETPSLRLREPEEL